MKKEVEDDKQRQKALYEEQKFKNEQEILRRRYEDEQRRDMRIDYGTLEKNKKKFEKLFVPEGSQGGKAADGKADKNKNGADDKGEKGDADAGGTEGGAQGGDNPEEFDVNEVFGKNKPVYSMENSAQAVPFEQSYGSQEVDQGLRQKNAEGDVERRTIADDIKKQQARNLKYQMEVEKELRPQVAGGAPIQGYGLNRNKTGDYNQYVQR